MRVMVIDDSRTMRTILSRILRQLGYEVTEAADGREALQLLKEHGPKELATLDWNMPGMTGLEVLKIIRANRAYDTMRIVMVTTETEMSQVVLALECGANEYLMKPFTPDMIRDKLLLLNLPEATTV